MGGFTGVRGYLIFDDPIGEDVGCGIGECVHALGVSERGYEKLERGLFLNGEARPCLLGGFTGVRRYLILDDPIRDEVGVGRRESALRVRVFEYGYEKIQRRHGGLLVRRGVRDSERDDG